MFGDEQSNRRGETMLKTIGAQVKRVQKGFHCDSCLHDSGSHHGNDYTPDDGFNH